jgi:hypothetical protein
MPVGLAGLQIFEKQKLNKVARYWCCAGLLKLLQEPFRSMTRNGLRSLSDCHPGRSCCSYNMLQYVTILYKDGPVDHVLVGVLLDARFEFTRPGSIRTIPLAHFFVS